MGIRATANIILLIVSGTEVSLVLVVIGTEGSPVLGVIEGVFLLGAKNGKSLSRNKELLARNQ